MPNLFTPLSLRSVTLRNRIGMSPMCMYSAPTGHPTPWHLVHLGSRAVGGAGLVMTEATAIDPAGRITPLDAGIWEDAQIESWAKVACFVSELGATAGMQIAHAGRKASTRPPWEGRASISDEDGGWQPVAPSPLPFRPEDRVPRALEENDLDLLVEQWRRAAGRVLRAGFRCLEIHMAHGYLLHEFLSPLCNQRTDRFGGTLDGRMRFPLRVAQAVREVWPDELPLLARISATDWAPGGWDPDQAVVLARALRALGVDLIDCSSGGAVPHQVVPAAPGYQVPFAERIRAEAEIPTAAVGLITNAAAADAIVREGKADLVFLGRALLRDPYWPRRAMRDLGQEIPWPPQYRWAVG